MDERLNVTTELDRCEWWGRMQAVLARDRSLRARGWRPGSFQVEARFSTCNLPAGCRDVVHPFLHPSDTIAVVAERAAAQAGMPGRGACFAVVTGTQWCAPNMTVGNYGSIGKDSTVRMQLRGKGGGRRGGARDVPETTRIWLKGVLRGLGDAAAATRSPTGKPGYAFLKRWVREQRAAGDNDEYIDWLLKVKPRTLDLQLQAVGEGSIASNRANCGHNSERDTIAEIIDSPRAVKTIQGLVAREITDASDIKCEFERRFPDMPVFEKRSWNRILEHDKLDLDCVWPLRGVHPHQDGQ